MLDVHIAGSFEAASQNHPAFGFDAKVHELIFFRDNVPIERFNLLMRLRDYYSDASFAASELPALTREIESLIDLLPPNSSIVSVLEQFRAACETAASTQQNVYLICD